MVRVYGPCFSIDASGTLADTLTFTKWKGRNVVRERVIPSNPKTGPQTGMRSMMKFLSQIWNGLSTANKATWEDLADATVISEFNAFTSFNMKRWRSFLTPSAETPAAEVGEGGDAPTTTPTGGIRQIQLSIAEGVAAPDWGWIIYRYIETGFTPAYSNCIAVIPLGVDPTIYIDTPLEPDTYYYRIGGFSLDGVAGTLEAEINATST